MLCEQRAVCQVYFVTALNDERVLTLKVPTRLTSTRLQNCSCSPATTASTICPATTTSTRLGCRDNRPGESNSHSLPLTSCNLIIIFLQEVDVVDHEFCLKLIVAIVKSNYFVRWTHFKFAFVRLLGELTIMLSID